jgi:uncharacterized protein
MRTADNAAMGAAMGAAMKFPVLLMLCAIACPSVAMADVKRGVDAWEAGDYATAVKEWRPLAIKGDADAQFNLGQAYRFGRGVARDPEAAEDWYRKAAARGHVRGEDNLGLIMFQNGDRAGAMPYLQRSSDRGDPRAQYVVATALFNGDVLAKDWPRAYALMTRAAIAGLPAASESLAKMDGFIPMTDRQKGLALAREIELRQSRPLAAIETLPEPPRAPAPGAAAVKPPPPVTAAAPATGRWRVQLGAFSQADKATSQWSQLKTRVASLGAYQHYVVKAGAVTRLQAGPLPSRGAADALCKSVAASGNACLVVAP